MKKEINAKIKSTNKETDALIIKSFMTFISVILDTTSPVVLERK